MADERILGDVESYYTGKLREHGPTPGGVDWNSEDSQYLRFRELMRVRDGDGSFSLNDYGCGYGALAGWLADREEGFAYTGFDISEPMVAEARSRAKTDDRCRFVTAESELEPADYTVASGIFNVRLETDESDWESYVLRTIERLWALGSNGIAFNMLTSYSDAHLMRDDLYYGDPRLIFDFCKRRLSRHVSIAHDYGLWEFTVVVRDHPSAA